MISYTGTQLATQVRMFLELAQPLDVKYGYPRGLPEGDGFVSFMNTVSDIVHAVGGRIMAERKTFVVTVQTKTAEDCLYYSQMIKYASSESAMYIMSEDIRRDPLVEVGWINTLILSVFNVTEATVTTYTADEVRKILQRIADNYLFVTSIYRGTMAESFIDLLVVPELEEKVYTYAEMLSIKQEYFDKLIFASKLR